MPNSLATRVTRCCVAAGVTTRRDTYIFQRTYLRNCPFHLALWDAANQAAHRGGSCPFAPRPCVCAKGVAA